MEQFHHNTAPVETTAAEYEEADRINRWFDAFNKHATHCSVSHHAQEATTFGPDTDLVQGFIEKELIVESEMKQLEEELEQI